jgi:hypothetical protein
MEKRVRRCKLWISPWQERGKQTILDTATLDPAGAWPVNLIRHAGGDSLPNNTVLAIVHPADRPRLIEAMPRHPAYDALRPNDSVLAHWLVERAITSDASLRDKLRWS